MLQAPWVLAGSGSVCCILWDCLAPWLYVTKSGLLEAFLGCFREDSCCCLLCNICVSNSKGTAMNNSFSPAHDARMYAYIHVHTYTHKHTGTRTHECTKPTLSFKRIHSSLDGIIFHLLLIVFSLCVTSLPRLALISGTSSYLSLSRNSGVIDMYHWF